MVGGKRTLNGLHIAPREMTVYGDPEGQGDDELGGAAINPDTLSKRHCKAGDSIPDCCRFIRAHLTTEQRKAMMVVGILYANEPDGNHRDKPSTYAWLKKKYLHVLQWAKQDFSHPREINRPGMPSGPLLM